MNAIKRIFICIFFFKKNTYTHAYTYIHTYIYIHIHTDIHFRRQSLFASSCWVAKCGKRTKFIVYQCWKKHAWRKMKRFFCCFVSNIILIRSSEYILLFFCKQKLTYQADSRIKRRFFLKKDEINFVYFVNLIVFVLLCL